MARGTEEEEEEVRSLLSRHRGRIIFDLKETDLVAVLVKNSVISASEEDLLKSVKCEKSKNEPDKGDCEVDASDVGKEGGDDDETPEKCDPEVKCSRLIDLIAKSGFEKFKQFCYAIENECPQLIEDLINDRLKYDTSTLTNAISEAVKDTDVTTDPDKDISDRSHRSMSYGGSVNITPPVAAPRKGVKSISPIPTNTNIQSPSTPEISIMKLPLDQINLNQKIDVASKFSQSPTTINTSNNYSSLLCHNTAASSPVTVRKRDKILHRFSDAATIGRKLKKKKNTNRGCRSMAEPIEVLADPVVEDDFFGGSFMVTMKIFRWPYIKKCPKPRFPKKKRRSSSLTVKTRLLRRKHHQTTYKRHRLSGSWCEDEEGYPYYEREHSYRPHRHHRTHPRTHRHNYHRTRSSGNVTDANLSYQQWNGYGSRRQHVNWTNASYNNPQLGPQLLPQQLQKQNVYWLRRPSVQDIRASLDRNQNAPSNSWNYVRNVDDYLQYGDGSDVAIMKGAQAHRRRRKVESKFDFFNINI